MAQINVNDPDPNRQVVQTTPAAPAQGDGSNNVAAGINMITTLIVLAVALVLVYFIFQMVMPMIR